MAWIVINIGCIECGVSSKIVAVFADKATAVGVAKACAQKYEWREGGQNSFEPFPLPQIGVIDPEYVIDLPASRGRRIDDAAQPREDR